MYRQPIKTVVTICRTYSSHHDIREVSVTFRTKVLLALKIFMQSVKWGAYLCSTVLSSQKKTSLRLATFKGQQVFDMDSSWTERINTGLEPDNSAGKQICQTYLLSDSKQYIYI